MVVVIHFVVASAACVEVLADGAPELATPNVVLAAFLWGLVKHDFGIVTYRFDCNVSIICTARFTRA